MFLSYQIQLFGGGVLDKLNSLSENSYLFIPYNVAKGVGGFVLRGLDYLEDRLALKDKRDFFCGNFSEELDINTKDITYITDIPRDEYSRAQKIIEKIKETLHLIRGLDYNFDLPLLEVSIEQFDINVKYLKLVKRYYRLLYNLNTMRGSVRTPQLFMIQQKLTAISLSYKKNSQVRPIFLKMLSINDQLDLLRDLFQEALDVRVVLSRVGYSTFMRYLNLNIELIEISIKYSEILESDNSVLGKFYEDLLYYKNVRNRVNKEMEWISQQKRSAKLHRQRHAEGVRTLQVKPLARTKPQRMHHQQRYI